MLRTRKHRRYNEEVNEDEELDGERKFDIQDQIKCERFDLTNKDKHLLEITGDQLTLDHFQKFGFEKPILVIKPDGLRLTVPQSNKFAVRDVRNAVGHQRIIDVMDVKTQKNIEMSMKDWCKYYESKNRDRLLNVISLEFSHTKLDEMIDSPMIVKLLDWVDLVWPKFLKEAQTESTNSIDKMKYPKVQKYCLMSVKGSYTDFHIDFGGTSVWYHILKGKKIFWMVPPTELNLQTFEEWTLSGMQQDVFFGDTVEECFRVELQAGNTFFIPSGWIHAVYTLEDSLVFGGNFLHSFGIENQLKVSKIEDATKVPIKFRYPFYTEILWYVVQHYVHCLTGKDHLHRPKTEVPKKKALREADEDDEDTEEAEDKSDSESEEEVKCDKPTASKKKKAASATPPVKRRRGRPPKTVKPPPSTGSDSSATEIDSDNEERLKAANKPTTCRMTKNSLLRLQYELDQKEQAEAKQNALRSPTKSSNSTIKSESVKKSSPIKQEQQKRTSEIKPSLDKELVTTTLTPDSKLNDWPALNTVTGSGASNCWSGAEKESKDPPKVHLTRYELNGLKALVKHLSKLSGAKKNLPALIRNSRHLLDDCKKMIAEHENDSPELAVTGRAITIELLNTKRADINEMIKRFFKEPTNGSDELASPSSHASPHKSTKHHLLLPSSLDALAARTEDKTKLLSDDEYTTGNHLKNSSPGKSSPQKDSTKILSAKKLHPHTPPALASPSTTSASTLQTPPVRPKSPPTRPLSNNQYTSKTRTNPHSANSGSTNNNFLLPGSFADLIAATSTEKKAFDVSGADVTSALFGTKDFGGAKQPKSPNKLSKSKAEDTTNVETHERERESITRDPIAELVSTPLPIATATSGPKEPQKVPPGPGHQQQPQQQTNSPEPPKTPVQQKRFINPAFRPMNKEKLIFASAPYVSPAHEQSRSNNLYPWQSPAVPVAPPTAPQQPSQQPAPTHQQQPSATAHGSNKLPCSSKETNQPYNSNQTQPNSYNPSAKPRSNSPTSISTSPKKDNKSSSTSPDPAQKSKQDNHPKQVVTSENATESSGTQPNNQQQDATNSISPTNNTMPHESKQQNLNSSLDSSPTNNQPAIPKMTIKLKTPIPKFVIKGEGNVVAKTSTEANSSGTSSVHEAEQSEKKSAKPRGPPKKSKEARLAIESYPDTANPIRVIPITTQQLLPQARQQPPVAHMASNLTRPSPMPISVVRIANPPKPPPVSVITSSHIAMNQANNNVASAADSKAKAKRKNRQKETDQTPPASKIVATGSSIIQNVASMPTVGYIQHIRPQAQQSVICGLVTQPPNSRANDGNKHTPQQQYLISRPLMFNSAPNIATQIHHMRASQMPIMASTPSSIASFSMPGLQPGARIVWAHQQRPTLMVRPPVTSAVSVTTFGPSIPTASSTITSNGTPIAAIRSTQNQSRTMSSSTSSNADNAALLSLATTALSTAPMTSSPTLSQVGVQAPITQALMVGSAPNQPFAFTPGQQHYLMQQMQMPMPMQIPMPTHFLPTTTTAATPAVAHRPGLSPGPVYFIRYKHK